MGTNKHESLELIPVLKNWRINKRPAIIRRGPLRILD